MVNISRILKFSTWHGFDEFDWNDLFILGGSVSQFSPNLHIGKDLKYNLMQFFSSLSKVSSQKPIDIILKILASLVFM